MWKNLKNIQWYFDPVFFRFGKELLAFSNGGDLNLKWLPQVAKEDDIKPIWFFALLPVKDKGILEVYGEYWGKMLYLYIPKAKQLWKVERGNEKIEVYECNSEKNFEGFLKELTAIKYLGNARPWLIYFYRRVEKENV